MTNDAPMSEVRRQCIEWRDAGQATIAFIEVRWSRNDRTHEIEAKAIFGVAPNEHTIILYPHGVFKSGCWGKAETRKQMNACKRELFAEMLAHGWTKKMLTRPIETKSFDYF